MNGYTSQDLIHAYRDIVAVESIEATFRALVQSQFSDSELLVYDYVRQNPYKTALQIAAALPLTRVHVSMCLLRLSRQGCVLREVHRGRKHKDQYVYYDGFSADAPRAGD